MYSRCQLLKHLETLTQEDKIIYTLLLMLKHKHQSIYTHCVNVSYSSYRLAEEIGLPEAECMRIALGGLVHDIGKLSISSKILYKHGKLDSDERLIIEKHPMTGISLLQRSKKSRWSKMQFYTITRDMTAKAIAINLEN